jgi:xylulokinase
MGKSYLIGVDAGVSFIKVGVYDVEGNSQATVIKNAPGQYPKAGVFLQSAEELLGIIREALKEAVVRAGVPGNAVEAIGFSGAMGGAMGVDEEWRVAADWSIISDTRFYPYVTRMLQAQSRKILEQSGTNFPIMGPKILWWKKEFPEQHDKVARWMVLAGFVIGRLGALPIEEATIDRTYLHFTGLADLRRSAWSQEICREFGIDLKRLSRIVTSNTIVARLSAEAAAACGLRQGTPLVSGAGDKPVGALGAGVVDPGVLIDESASFGALSLCTDKYVPDLARRTLENLPSPIVGHYLPSCYLFGSGVTHAWFRDVFGEEEKQLAFRTGSSAFPILDEKASKVPPGSEGLLALGLFGGRGYPSDPDIKGLWIGHSWAHKKEHFYRALLESFAYEYGCVLEVMKKNHPELAFNEIRVIGGGSRSDLWNQIKADVLGVPYARLSRDDYALLGDVLLAGNAVGVFPDLAAAARRHIQVIQRYLPDLNRHAQYQRYMDLYQGLFDRTRGIFEGLKSLSTGQAEGA